MIFVELRMNSNNHYIIDFMEGLVIGSCKNCQECCLAGEEDAFDEEPHENAHITARPQRFEKILSKNSGKF